MEHFKVCIIHIILCIKNNKMKQILMNYFFKPYKNNIIIKNNRTQAYRYLLCAKTIDQLEEFEIQPSMYYNN